MKHLKYLSVGAGMILLMLFAIGLIILAFVGILWVYLHYTVVVWTVVVIGLLIFGSYKLGKDWYEV